MEQSKIKYTDRMGFHMLLAATGGLMDAYSYVERGNVFATGQTGNFMLVAIRFLSKDYKGMGQACVPIGAFWIGVFLARHFYYKIYHQKRTNWISGILLLEIAVLFGVGFIPGTLPYWFANTAVSFAAAVQFCTFRNFGGNAAYAPVFCTGNMRSCAEMYYEGFVRKDRECRIKAYHYTEILSAFFAGALLGTGMSGLLGEKTIWLACVLLFVAWKTVDVERKGENPFNTFRINRIFTF
jgi:uncharacterized membrane protein YoaK (UPF0700 family)